MSKNRLPLELFCDILEKEKFPCTVSPRYTRCMPAIAFPEP